MIYQDRMGRRKQSRNAQQNENLVGGSKPGFDRTALEAHGSDFMTRSRLRVLPGRVGDGGGSSLKLGMGSKFLRVHA